MSVIEKLRHLFRPPAVRVTAYRCLDCGSTQGMNPDSCPECGGAVEEAEQAIEYTYWGPYQ